MPKVTIVGAGQTGATTAHWIAERDLADVVLIDVVEGMPQGKGLDLAQAMPIIGSDSRVSGTNEYAETAGSDIVIITAGLPRKPGMSRDDLLEANSKIVREAVQQSLAASPEAILVILTNPLDAMAFLAMKVGGLPRERVIGQAGILDSARMRAFVAAELDVSVQNVHCYVLGGHGDEMVPLTRHSNVAGVPLADALPPERLEAIVGTRTWPVFRWGRPCRPNGWKRSSIALAKAAARSSACSRPAVRSMRRRRRWPRWRRRSCSTGI